MYMPFIKMLDNQYLKEEEENKEQDLEEDLSFDDLTF